MNGGTLKFYNESRGFGIIRPDLGGSDVFVHGSAFAKSGLAPERGMRLRYERYKLPDGRHKAVKLRAEID
ncbi:cold-shock protein [Bradyrhizobium sp. USDA 10063]